MPNVELQPLKLSTWRKIALGTWGKGGDPSVYGTLALNATKILERQKKWQSEKGTKPPTITTIVARAVALTLHKHPQINGLIRLGRIYLRTSVTLFLQATVDDAGHELSGVVIYDAETKSLEDIGSELKTKAKAIREDKDPQFKKAKSTFGGLPAWMMKCVLNTLSFLLYTLNLDLRWMGLPKDPFGSVMITSIGSIGLDDAFAPLVPYSRVPMLLAIGTIQDTPVVQDGKIVSAPIFKMCVTIDHRFIDGIHGARMAKTVRYLLETDAGLNELGL